KEEEGSVEGDVFLAFAQGPIPPPGPVWQALDKIFLAFLTLLMLEAAYKLLWPLPWAKFRDWLLRTPEEEAALEL
ncbi:small integral membrane protein 40-like, partial [Mus caroli]|uniref:Small integral membrane protein 40-like n=1 Tax=Mus caroli TaxID=10089 RepID=A0A6P7QQD1_MUSCR